MPPGQPGWYLARLPFRGGRLPDGEQLRLLCKFTSIITHGAIASLTTTVYHGIIYILTTLYFAQKGACHVAAVLSRRLVFRSAIPGSGEGAASCVARSA